MGIADERDKRLVGERMHFVVLAASAGVHSFRFLPFTLKLVGGLEDSVILRGRHSGRLQQA